MVLPLLSVSGIVVMSSNGSTVTVLLEDCAATYGKSRNSTLQIKNLDNIVTDAVDGMDREGRKSSSQIHKGAVVGVRA